MLPGRKTIAGQSPFLTVIFKRFIFLDKAFFHKSFLNLILNLLNFNPRHA